MRDVFLTFLRLGSTSFGGPVAHLGYFRREFVDRQRWVDERLFGQIVALCSILPGPTSSQVGVVVGFLRAGPSGAVAAWLGFTLPSALALGATAALLTTIESTTRGSSLLWLDGLLGGLTAAAIGIVAQAVLVMARTQCPDAPTKSIAAGGAGLTLALAGAPGLQWLPIATGALMGVVLLSRAVPTHAVDAAPDQPIKISRNVAIVAGTLFIALILIAAGVAGASPVGSFIATIIRAGSLVFGGGHVVLPLLQSLVPAHLISSRDFYAGYGAAQAVPGPLFTFATFLGSANRSSLHGAGGAIVATALIFLPSFLLVFACLPILGALRANQAASSALRGANAAVVGLLGALLYSPLLLGLGSSVWRIALALATFTLVAAWSVAPWVAVLVAGSAGAWAAVATGSLL